MSGAFRNFLATRTGRIRAGECRTRRTSWIVSCLFISDKCIRMITTLLPFWRDIFDNFIQTHKQYTHTYICIKSSNISHQKGSV